MSVARRRQMSSSGVLRLLGVGDAVARTPSPGYSISVSASVFCLCPSQIISVAETVVDGRQADAGA